MESAGYRLTDSIGREIVYAGLLMVEQDFSKLGEFYEMLTTSRVNKSFLTNMLALLLVLMGLTFSRTVQRLLSLF